MVGLGIAGASPIVKTHTIAGEQMVSSTDSSTKDAGSLMVAYTRARDLGTEAAGGHAAR